VNNFDESADRLAMALQSPGMFLVHEWLTGIPGQPLARLVEPQRGRWILCGYGRFGKAVASQFVKGGVSFRVIEAFPEKTGAPEGTVNGRGTEAPTLEEAGTIGATGIVAGTDNDTNNLSIIVTAQELNPELFTVARQNQRTNRELFLAAGVDLIMERTDIMAHEVLALLLTPSLESFLSLARARGADWNNQLVSRLAAILDDLGPEVFSIPISAESAPAALGRLQEGGTVPLAGLLRDPRDRERVLPVICLMLTRGEENIPLPDSDRELQPGDRLLLAGREGSRRLLESGLANPNVLSYLLTGLDRPSGSIFRALAGSR
jgi:Trk K+ transport system NAD-binding subunit